MTTRGIFILENVRSRQREGDWVPLPSVFGRDGLQNVGYVVGGSDSSDNSVSYYQAITYSNDTRSNVANLPQGRAGVYGLASPINGYAVGGGPGDPGSPGGYFSSSNRLTFSTQTNSALPGVNMGVAFARGGSAGSSTAGYIAGGYSNPGESTGWSRLEKLTYSTETIARIPANLPGVGYGGATGHSQSATANGDLFGLWLGGNLFPSPSSNLTGTFYWKLGFATDQWASAPHWNLAGPGNRMQKAGMTASPTGAYVVGGSYPSNTAVQKISFADESNSVVTNTAAPGRTDLTGTGNPSTGYYAGGATGNNANGTGGSVSSIVEKMSYESETISRVPALDLANGLSEVGSMSATADNKVLQPQYRWIDNAPASFNFGYSMMGRTSSNWAPGTEMGKTYKVDYGTDTSAAIPLVAYGYEQSFGGGNSTHAYKMGGRSNDVPADGSEIQEKFAYATDTRLYNTSTYGNRRYGSFAVTHGETTLYGVGGRGSSSNQLQSNVYKMPYSSDTWSTATATANIATSRRNGASVATSTHGYFAGGGNLPGNPASPIYRSDVDKMTFASETTNRIPSANLLSNVLGNRGFSRGDAGYIMGGVTPSGNYLSNLDKITFSTDTTSAFPSNLPDPVRSNQTMSSDSSGYATGGQGPAPAGWDRSTVSKMSYSTGTFSAAGNLPTYQNYGIGLSAGSDNLPFQVAPPATPTSGSSPLADSAPNFGVAGGGDVIPGGVYTLFDKLEYSTETNSVLPSSDATSGTGAYSQRSITSQTEGWSNSAAGTHLWKFVYSTSTQNPSPASHTIRNFANGFAISNKTEGYFGGGANVGTPGPSYSGGPSLSIDKFTFSTSTASQVPDGTGTPSSGNYSFNTGNVGHQEVGYYAGGNSRSMGKYVYATNTQSTTSNKLTSVNQKGMGAGNATYGYFIAGDRSTTDRLDYSTDTVNSITSASYPPGDQTYGAASHSSSEAGYTQSGRSPSAPISPFFYHWSNTRKITYSTSTISELPASADVSVGRNDYSGMSARQNNNGSATPAPNVV